MTNEQVRQWFRTVTSWLIPLMTNGQVVFFESYKKLEEGQDGLRSDQKVVAFDLEDSQTEINGDTFTESRTYLLAVLTKSPTDQLAAIDLANQMIIQVANKIKEAMDYNQLDGFELSIPITSIRSKGDMLVGAEATIRASFTIQNDPSVWE